MRFQLQVWRLLLLVFKIKIQGLKPKVENVEIGRHKDGWGLETGRALKPPASHPPPNMGARCVVLSYK